METDPPSSSPSPTLPIPEAARRFNLLLAEDNLPDALIVREAIRLEGLPLDVHIASDGQQAIDFITRAEEDDNAPCPHFLLLDLNLPKRDGFEVLQRLRASPKCRDVPVLIFTSSDSPSDLSTAASMGASYFRKPPSYEEFMKLGGVLKKLLRDRGMT
ncbi:MAG: response regulator [Bryobacteraceae bacterium]